MPERATGTGTRNGRGQRPAVRSHGVGAAAGAGTGSDEYRTRGGCGCGGGGGGGRGVPWGLGADWRTRPGTTPPLGRGAAAAGRASLLPPPQPQPSSAAPSAGCSAPGVCVRDPRRRRRRPRETFFPFDPRCDGGGVIKAAAGDGAKGGRCAAWGGVGGDCTASASCGSSAFGVDGSFLAAILRMRASVPWDGGGAPTAVGWPRLGLASDTASRSLFNARRDERAEAITTSFIVNPRDFTPGRPRNLASGTTAAAASSTAACAAPSRPISEDSPVM